jgi:hypothetical protein
MTAPLDLDAFLRTDPRDVGCGPAMNLLHAYADRHVIAPGEAARRKVDVAQTGPTFTFVRPQTCASSRPNGCGDRPFSA